MWPLDEAPPKSEDQLVWFALFGVLYLAFYVFTSPFVGNPELLNTWTPYVYLSMGLYAWLFSAAALHTPLHSLGLVESTIKQPVSLLFPFFSATFVLLVALEAISVLVLSRFNHRLSAAWRPTNVSLVRSFMNVLRNSAAISVACVALIVHCDASIEAPHPEPDEMISVVYNLQACEKLFKFSLSDAETFVPASYRGAILIWFVGVALAMTNFFLERVSGLRVISFHWLADRAEEEEPIIAEGVVLPERLPPEHNRSMVPWYSNVLFDTAVQLLISFKVFLGRFDQRSLQRALYPDDADYCFDHLSARNELWLDFMADTGDGFSSTYQIARLMAQPELQVECGDRKTLPRGEALVIGGDLAYPFPDTETYETRLFRPFEYAMKPPEIYNPANLAMHKTAVVPGTKGTRLPLYDGPTAFAIPGNHDWFDGLNTFTRLICQRDWLGGWWLPQKTSHFCLALPHGWWLLGLDVALEDDVNSEQFAWVERLAKERIGPKDAVIVLTHTPRWVLDVYEARSKSEEKLQHLLNTALCGRVAVRLAGDVHNYMRHSLVDPPSSPSPSPSPSPRPSPPPSPRRAFDRRAKRGSNSPLSPLRQHFPHMFADEDSDGGAAKRRSAPSVPPQHLIISGGGGAFLHPTHAPNVDQIESNGATYERVKCYPPAHVSRRYTLLNVVGFRRINWRFDIIGGICYFALVSSMFPRCSVGEILDAPTWASVVHRLGVEFSALLRDLVTKSYVSLLVLVVMFMVLAAFTDSPSVPKQLGVGVLMSACHVLAAFTVLLVFECVLELATARGALAQDGPDSLFRYWSSSLPDFSPLRDYDLLGLAELYAELLRVAMTIFDVPEVVALYRQRICSGGADSLGRTELWTYYVSVFPYFWVLATPTVSAVFGSYLYVALNAFAAHYNEAFSSLRIASYKHFIRIHVREDGQLELFVLGVDKMPRRWIRDPLWSGGSRARAENKLPSHRWTRPSFWKPLLSKVDNMLRLDFEDPSLDRKLNLSDRSVVRLVDRVVIPKRPAA